MIVSLTEGLRLLVSWRHYPVMREKADLAGLVVAVEVEIGPGIEAFRANPSVLEEEICEALCRRGANAYPIQKMACLKPDYTLKVRVSNIEGPNSVLEYGCWITDKRGKETDLSTVFNQRKGLVEFLPNKAVRTLAEYLAR